MTRRDLAAALHHVSRLAGPVTDHHRLELEAILLRAVVEAEMVERVGMRAWHVDRLRAGVS